MDLRDSSKKMSKSAKSDSSRIELLDSPDQVRAKIVKANTDSEGTVAYSETRPELANLFRIFAGVTGLTIQEIEQMGWANTYHFKDGLAEAVIEHIRPIQERTQEILDSGQVDQYLEAGREKAARLAETTLAHVYQLIGL